MKKSAVQRFWGRKMEFETDVYQKMMEAVCVELKKTRNILIARIIQRFKTQLADKSVVADIYIYIYIYMGQSPENWSKL